MTLKVVVWGTGNVGRHALRGVLSHPSLELAGVWVSSAAKEGLDAGVLAGLGTEVGIAATRDAAGLVGLRPDCIVHAAMADNRLGEALSDLEGFLAAGIHVASSGPVLVHYAAPGDPVAARLDAAGRQGGAALWVNGIDPGFANDTLPLALCGISERIDQVRCSEILNYGTYDQPMVLFEIMGFGRPLSEVPLLLQPGVLAASWGGAVRQIAAGLGVELEGIVEHHERVEAPEGFAIAAGRIPRHGAAALRFSVVGMVAGRPAIVVEHVTRLRGDLAPHWPQPAGQGCYRVEVRGEPDYTLDLQLVGSDGDPNTAGLTATAMRLVNALPALVAAPPGLRSALDLPLATGRGIGGSAPPAGDARGGS